MGCDGFPLGWLTRPLRSSTPDPSPRWRVRAVFGMTHSKNWRVRAVFGGRILKNRLAKGRFSFLAFKDLFYGFDGVGVRGKLVITYSHNAREAESVA